MSLKIGLWNYFFGPTHQTSAINLKFCFRTYFEVFDAIVNAGREDLVFSTAPCLSDYLNDLLQGTAHSVEHGVFVDPCRLAIRMPQASLWKEFNVKRQTS